MSWVTVVICGGVALVAAVTIWTVCVAAARAESKMENDEPYE